MTRPSRRGLRGSKRASRKVSKRGGSSADLILVVASLLTGCDSANSRPHDAQAGQQQAAPWPGLGAYTQAAGAARPARAARLGDEALVRRHESERGRPGDVVLDNGIVRFVIGGSTQSDGSLHFAGNLIDAEFAGEAAAYAYDGVDELDPLVNGCPIGASEIEIITDGSAGGAAEVVVKGPEVVVPEVLNLHGAQPRAWGLDVELRYSLQPGSSALRIETHVHNPLTEAVEVEIGDFALFGSDEASPFTLPGGMLRDFGATSVDVLGVVHDSLPWAAAIEAEEGALELIAGASVRDLVGDDDTALWQYVCGRRSLQPDASYTSARSLVLGHDIASTLLPRFTRGEARMGRVTGRVDSGNEALRGVRISFFETTPKDAAPGSQDASDAGSDATTGLDATTGPDDAAGAERGTTAAPMPDAEALRPRFVAQTFSAQDGTFDAQLPAGEYRVLLSARGIGEGLQVPGRLRWLAEGHPPVPEQRVVVEPDAAAELAFDAAPAATLDVGVQDEAGRGLAAKLSLQRSEPALPPQPELGERQPYKHVTEVFWTLEGHAHIAVPPGTYALTVSHGPLFSIDRREDVVLEAGANPALEVTLAQRVPAAGYVAIDSHLHAMDSQHGRATRAERVITSLADGLDVQVATDHDRIVDYAPVIDALGAHGRILPIASAELSTHGSHHNIWPLRYDAAQPNGGALRWWLGGTLDELYDRSAALGGIVFQVNHGLEYFEHADFDPKTGSATESDTFTFRFNAMEIYNGARSPGTLLPIWYALLNAGRTVAPLGVSDSHERLNEEGTARTYVRVDAATSQLPAPDDVARAVVALRTVASTGPLVQFSAQHGAAQVGDRLALGCDAPSPCPVRMRIEVWAPEWVQIARVSLIANGAPLQRWDASSQPAVTMPTAAEPARWFQHELDITPPASGWYAVLVEGDRDLSPVYPGTRAWAHTAPIFIDLP